MKGFPRPRLPASGVLVSESFGEEKRGWGTAETSLGLGKGCPDTPLLLPPARTSKRTSPLPCRLPLPPPSPATFLRLPLSESQAAASWVAPGGGSLPSPGRAPRVWLSSRRFSNGPAPSLTPKPESSLSRKWRWAQSSLLPSVAATSCICTHGHSQILPTALSQSRL